LELIPTDKHLKIQYNYLPKTRCGFCACSVSLTYKVDSQYIRASQSRLHWGRIVVVFRLHLMMDSVSDVGEFHLYLQLFILQWGFLFLFFTDNAHTCVEINLYPFRTKIAINKTW